MFVQISVIKKSAFSVVPCGHLMAIFITFTVRLGIGQHLTKLNSHHLITSHPTHRLSPRDKCGITCER